MSQPIVKNAADENQVAEAKAKEKSGSQRDRNDIHELVAIPAFNRFMARHVVDIVDRISAHASGSWTYFQEGERNICLKLKAEISSVSPEGWMEIIKCNSERKGVK